MSADDDRGNYTVGYCRPPLHARFKPGQSGNPSGRSKDCKNLKTLLREILNEQIALQDGAQSRKVSKAEAIMRRLIIGALKGDTRDLPALFRIAERTGQFEEAYKGIDRIERIERVIVDWEPIPQEQTAAPLLPAINDFSREEP